MRKEYFVQFWQHIDILTYFVHGHISIPPPTWVNVAHRNGVQVLGVLCFEGNDLNTAAMFEEEGGKYWLSDRLAEMASYYGFDGWLLNIESPVHKPDKKAWGDGEAATAMDGFIARLRQALSDRGVPKKGKVMW